MFVCSFGLWTFVSCLNARETTVPNRQRRKHNRYEGLTTSPCLRLSPMCVCVCLSLRFPISVFLCLFCLPCSPPSSMQEYTRRIPGITPRWHRSRHVHTHAHTRQQYGATQRARETRGEGRDGFPRSLSWLRCTCLSPHKLCRV